MTADKRPIAGAAADVGARSGQEDSHKIVALKPSSDNEARALCVIADGMGGHVGGKIASETAIEAFVAAFKAGGHEASKERLRTALFAANQAVSERVIEDPGLEGMGCTLVAAYKKSGRLNWVSVGDSPMWRLRNGRLKRLNEDHSVYGELKKQVKAGALSAEEAATDPRRNALRSAVMGGGISLIDSSKAALEDGDRVLIASDGVETLSEAEIAAELLATLEAPPAQAAEALVDAVVARNAPRQDNVSVIILDHRAEHSAKPGLAALSDVALPRRAVDMMIGGAAGLVIGALATFALIGGAPQADIAGGQKSGQSGAVVDSGPSDPVDPDKEAELEDSQEQVTRAIQTLKPDGEAAVDGEETAEPSNSANDAPPQEPDAEIEVPGNAGGGAATDTTEELEGPKERPSDTEAGGLSEQN